MSWNRSIGTNLSISAILILVSAQLLVRIHRACGLKDVTGCENPFLSLFHAHLISPISNSPFNHAISLRSLAYRPGAFNSLLAESEY